MLGMWYQPLPISHKNVIPETLQNNSIMAEYYEKRIKRAHKPHNTQIYPPKWTMSTGNLEKLVPLCQKEGYEKLQIAYKVTSQESS